MSGHILRGLTEALPDDLGLLVAETHDNMPAVMRRLEVFTPPPHSTWTPHGLHTIPCRFHVDSIPSYGICFGCDPTYFGVSIPPGFHME